MKVSMWLWDCRGHFSSAHSSDSTGSLCAVSLCRWAEYSLINLFLVLCEGSNFNSPLGIDIRPHLQYSCGPKTPILILKREILKAPKPYTLPTPKVASYQFTFWLYSFSSSACFPLGNLLYFLVSSAVHVENDFYILFLISRNFEIGQFSGHLISCIVGNGNPSPDIIAKSTNFITQNFKVYYIDFKNKAC